MPIEDEMHGRGEPRRRVHAVGDVADRHALLGDAWVERAPHRARDLAVQRRDGVGAMRELERQHRHAERLARVAGVDAAEAHEPRLVHAERVAQRPEVLLDHVGGEAIVPRGHRRVRREDDLRRDAAARLVRGDAFSHHPLVHELQRREGAVALVQVNDAGHDVERRQRADAADAEQQLLAEPDAVVAAVQSGRAARDPPGGSLRRPSRAAGGCCGRR